jgi:hypothetical protein
MIKVLLLIAIKSLRLLETVVVFLLLEVRLLVIIVTLRRVMLLSALTGRPTLLLGTSLPTLFYVFG